MVGRHVNINKAAALKKNESAKIPFFFPGRLLRLARRFTFCSQIGWLLAMLFGIPQLSPTEGKHLWMFLDDWGNTYFSLFSKPQSQAFETSPRCQHQDVLEGVPRIPLALGANFECTRNPYIPEITRCLTGNQLQEIHTCTLHEGIFTLFAHGLVFVATRVSVHCID